MASFPKYLLALLLFGSNGIVASFIALESGAVVFLRTLAGTALLAVLYLVTRRRTPLRCTRRSFLLLAASGVAMGASWMFLYEAYNLVGVSMATLAYYCAPMLVMAVSPVLFGERLTFAKVVGIAVVMGGMLLVNGDALASGGLSWGLACGLLAAVLFALMVVLSKKAPGPEGAGRALMQLGFAFATSAVCLFAQHGFDAAACVASVTPSFSDVVPVLFLGLVNTGLGCFLYFTTLPRLSASTVSICGYLEPISALVFAAVFLGEALAPIQLMGALLVVGGAAFGELAGRIRHPVPTAVSSPTSQAHGVTASMQRSRGVQALRSIRARSAASVALHLR